MLSWLILITWLTCSITDLFCALCVFIICSISFIKDQKKRINGSVVIAQGSHPIPFRTRTWNFVAPMVLQLKLRKSRSLPNLLYALSLRFLSLSLLLLPPISQWSRHPPRRLFFIFLDIIICCWCLYSDYLSSLLLSFIYVLQALLFWNHSYLYSLAWNMISFKCSLKLIYLASRLQKSSLKHIIFCSVLLKWNCCSILCANTLNPLYPFYMPLVP